MHQPICRRTLVLSVVATLFTVVAPALGADSAPAGPLASTLQPFVDKHVIGGAVMLVADRDKVLDIEAVGYSNLNPREPMRPDGLFWIASMSKSLTASALMMLVDEGKVNIDDPVEKYLPEFKGQLVDDPTEKDHHPHPPRHPITIKECLTHTSGLVAANDKTLKRFSVLKDNVAEYASRPLKREPGTKYEYNNCGICTAGRIIEVVSGVPYAQFMQQRLFDPLEMTDTTFWPTEEQARRLAHAVRLAADKINLEQNEFDKNVTPALIAKLGKGVAVPQPILEDMGIGELTDYANHFAEPAGGLFSTAKDIGRFCQMLLNGGIDHGKRLLSEKAIAQMTGNQTGAILVSPQEAYGLGWSVKLRADEGPGVGSFGHRGARRTAMWVDPRNQLVMVLLMERMDMPGKDQTELYSAAFKAAEEKFGKGR